MIKSPVRARRISSRFTPTKIAPGPRRVPVLRTVILRPVTRRNETFWVRTPPGQIRRGVETLRIVAAVTTRSSQARKPPRRTGSFSSPERSFSPDRFPVRRIVGNSPPSVRRNSISRCRRKNPVYRLFFRNSCTVFPYPGSTARTGAHPARARRGRRRRGRCARLPLPRHGDGGDPVFACCAAKRGSPAAEGPVGHGTIVANGYRRLTGLFVMHFAMIACPPSHRDRAVRGTG